MDVSSLKPTDRVSAAFTNTNGTASADVVLETAEVKKETSKAETRKDDKKELTNDELLPITRELNKFMTYLNADIQFQLHEKTQRLIVRVVDTKENKVLREFPPEELLDTIANIREYVGVLLDKKV